MLASLAGAITFTGVSSLSRKSFGRKPFGSRFILSDILRIQMTLAKVRSCVWAVEHAGKVLSKPKSLASIAGMMAHCRIFCICPVLIDMIGGANGAVVFRSMSVT